MYKRWTIFMENIQADLKSFCFVWAVLLLFRIVFVLIMYEYVETGTSYFDFCFALYYGGRISLKTAGIIFLINTVFVTFPSLVSGRLRWQWLRLLNTTGYLCLLSILFFAKFPYYQEFHTGFNQMLFNTFQDDQMAIFSTLVDQYQLGWRVGGALSLTVGFFYLVRRLLRTKVWRLPVYKSKKRLFLHQTTVCMMLVVIAVFVRFGGSLTYAHSLHWENCSLAKGNFLNEVILDDVQALYRAYSIKRRTENGMASGVDQTRLKEYLMAKSNGALRGKHLDDYLFHEALGSQIHKPKHIFILIGESYAQWPLLGQYENLHIADGMKGIMQEENAAFITAFLPNGAFTPMAANALISGLSDVGIYPNYQQGSYAGVYQTALAPQMKGLGYKTAFWYSGFSGWERIRDFALAQGFDEFHSASDFAYERGNVWGCDDEFLFQALYRQLEAENTPTVHVVLTVSNHAPYSIDLEAAGFDAQKVRAVLPEDVKQDQDLIKRLGHYWYTDKQISDFVRFAYAKYPEDSLFIITGDHADRTNIDKQPNLFERYTVPFILYGNGVHRDLFPRDAAGGHVNIAATLFELIAPRGFGYYSLGESLTRGSEIGFNHNVWISANAIGKIDEKESAALANGGADLTAERKQAIHTVNVMRTISWWRTMKGNDIE